MKEAAIYPITSPLQLAEHAPYVHNAVYMTSGRTSTRLMSG